MSLVQAYSAQTAYSWIRPTGAAGILDSVWARNSRYRLHRMDAALYVNFRTTFGLPRRPDVTPRPSRCRVAVGDYRSLDARRRPAALRRSSISSGSTCRARMDPAGTRLQHLHFGAPWTHGRWDLHGPGERNNGSVATLTHSAASSVYDHSVVAAARETRRPRDRLRASSRRSAGTGLVLTGPRYVDVREPRIAATFRVAASPRLDFC